MNFAEGRSFRFEFPDLHSTITFLAWHSIDHSLCMLLEREKDGNVYKVRSEGSCSTSSALTIITTELQYPVN
jgi:hypothetical protein